MNAAPVGGAVHERRRGQRADVASLRVRHDLFDRIHRLRVERGAEDVLLSPQYALGHTRGPARVQRVEIVGREPLRRVGLGPLERRLVVERTRHQAFAGLVAHLDPQLHLRHAIADSRERRCEPGVEHDRLRLRVAKEVDELLLDVAVVHVDRHAARLERAEHALQILVAVVEVERDVVLARLPVLEGGAIRMAAEPVPAQNVGQTARAIRGVPPREASIAKDEALALGIALGDGLVNGGEIQHWFSSAPLSTPTEIACREFGDVQACTAAKRCNATSPVRVATQRSGAVAPGAPKPPSACCSVSRPTTSSSRSSVAPGIAWASHRSSA